VYIFDKKTTFLNRCDINGCKIIDTNFPTRTRIESGYITTQNSSKLFEEEKNMPAAVVRNEEEAPSEEIEVVKQEDKAPTEQVSQTKSEEKNEKEDKNNDQDNKEGSDREIEPGVTPIQARREDGDEKK
jgi:hypothetical protein